ncbi:MAG: DUF4384 domain-containing protein [Hyphomicrobiaceae bacterium]|nr:DUF4384 domain-containing protein [Hyphomicrobiaceae bacterium]
MMRVRGAAVLRRVAMLAVATAIAAWQPALAQSPPPSDGTAPAAANAKPAERQRDGDVSPPPADAGPQDGAAASPPAQPSPSEPTLTEVTKALAPRSLLPPADPVAATAYAVLDKHCARCHQGGRLALPAPAAGFGNVLRLDELANTPWLVQPGNPDGSRLYQSMLRRLMPSDVLQDGASSSAPTSQEMAAVRAWIESLSPRPHCRDRRRVGFEDHAAAMAKTAAEAGDGAARLRFLSIAHLHNGCVAFEALAAYRQALVKLINSLSWKPALVQVLPVDETRTLYRIDLGDLGWLPEHWERILQSGNDPLGLTPSVPRDVRKQLGTEFPVARADWLAANVLRAPLYYDVLGLPGTGPEILKILQINADRQTQESKVQRIPVKPSQVSIQPSLIERLIGRTGPVWTAYHVIARDGSPDPSEAAVSPGQEPVPHHAARTMFSLPNGLPAFAIVGQRGDRLDELPPDIARPHVGDRGSIRAGLDCLACHGSGPVRSQVAGAAASAMNEALARDTAAVAEAHRRLGLVPGGTLDGVEPVVALALEHVRPLAAVRAAAELGVEVEDLMRISEGDKPAAILTRRLLQGLVSRAEIEARGREIVEALGRVPAGEPQSQAAAQSATGPGRHPSGAAVTDVAARKEEGELSSIDAGPGLIIYSDKVRYKRGDQLRLVVKTTADCHLTVISVDQRGRGTVIFPSDFETSTMLAAGQELKLPGAGAPYSFRLNETGREHIVALCNEASASTDGIVHDFERQRFTDLGNYAAYVAQHGGIDPVQQSQSSGSKRAEPRQRGRRRVRVEQAPSQAARPDQIARTAISVVVD